MQVDVPACIFLGVSKTASDVSVKNLSIHGLSFRSRKYFSQGTPFQLIFSSQNAGRNVKKIQAVVLRCEPLKGLSSDRFKIGAKFLFESNMFGETENHSTAEKKPSALQPIHVQRSVEMTRHNKGVRLKAQVGNKSALSEPVRAVRKGEIRAEFFQFIQTSQSQETVHTFIKVRESRITDINPSTLSTPILPEEIVPGNSMPEMSDGENPFAKRLPNLR